jgi:hypothetical protein
MRTVALDLGVQKTAYCEVSGGHVIKRATVSDVESLRCLLGPEQAAARVGSKRAAKHGTCTICSSGGATMYF